MPETALDGSRLLIDAGTDPPRVWLETEEGPRYVHSRYDPRREAQRILQQLKVRDGDLVVIVGGGLGYLSRELAATAAGVNTLVIEPDRSTAVTLGCRSEVGSASELIVETDSAQALRRITTRQMNLGFCDVVLYVNPAYAAAFPAYVQSITASLRPGRNRSSFRTAFKPVSRQQVGRVLLLDTGYFLQAELALGLSTLELKQATVTVANRSFRFTPGSRRLRYEAAPDFIPRLLQCVAEFKPDLLLTVNHLGFDREGRLAALLQELQLPVAVWYVDSPTYILNGQLQGVSYDHHLFVWESSYLPELARAGFKNVSHLPLAGANHMRGGGAGERLGRGVFVGGSNNSGIRVWREKPRLRLSEEEIDRIVAAQRARPDVGIQQHLQNAGVAGDSELLRRNTESLLVLQTTRRERIELLRQVPVDVYGDEDWSELLGPGRRVLSPVDYYDELPEVYRRHAVHLNQTSFQMNSTVNQRVFDVPLCGGLLVTDYRSDLADLFDIKRECVLYHTPVEAADKLRWYLDNPETADSVAALARRRIESEHLYHHRLRTMINTINARLREEE